jgi:tetratricopeptide (TPR) repeat protein
MAIALCSPVIDFHRSRKEEKNFAEVIPIELQWLGEMQAEVGEYNTAIDTLHEALDMLEAEDPSRAEPLCVLASVYSRLGDYKSAAEIYENALDIERVYLDGEPGLAITINNLADVYAVMGRFDDALPLLQEAWEINCKHMNPSRSREMHHDGRRLASFLIARGQFGQARVVLDAVVDHPGKVDHRGRERAMLVPPGTPRAEFHEDLYRLCVCMLLDNTDLYRAAKLIKFAMAICLEVQDTQGGGGGEGGGRDGDNESLGTSVASRKSGSGRSNMPGSDAAFSGVSGGGRDLRARNVSRTNELPKYTWLAGDIELARGKVESAELLQQKSKELAKVEWEASIAPTHKSIRNKYLHSKTQALQHTVSTIHAIRKQLAEHEASGGHGATVANEATMGNARHQLVRGLAKQEFVLTDLLNEVGALMVTQGNGQGLKNLEASYERRYDCV